MPSDLETHCPKNEYSRIGQTLEMHSNLNNITSSSSPSCSNLQTNELDTSNDGKVCPTPGCDGSGNTKSMYTFHRSVQRCPLMRIKLDQQKGHLSAQQVNDIQSTRVAPITDEGQTSSIKASSNKDSLAHKGKYSSMSRTRNGEQKRNGAKSKTPSPSTTPIKNERTIKTRRSLAISQNNGNNHCSKNNVKKKKQEEVTKSRVILKNKTVKPSSKMVMSKKKLKSTSVPNGKDVSNIMEAKSITFRSNIQSKNGKTKKNLSTKTNVLVKLKQEPIESKRIVLTIPLSKDIKSTSPTSVKTKNSPKNASKVKIVSEHSASTNDNKKKSTETIKTTNGKRKLDKNVSSLSEMNKKQKLALKPKLSKVKQIKEENQTETSILESISHDPTKDKIESSQNDETEPIQLNVLNCDLETIDLVQEQKKHLQIMIGQCHIRFRELQDEEFALFKKLSSLEDEVEELGLNQISNLETNREFVEICKNIDELNDELIPKDSEESLFHAYLDRIESVAMNRDHNPKLFLLLKNSFKKIWLQL